MSNIFESGELISVPVLSPLFFKSLAQLRYEIGHYQNQIRYANVKGRYVLRRQVKKLDKLLLTFQSQNQPVASAQSLHNQSQQPHLMKSSTDCLS